MAREMAEIDVEVVRHGTAAVLVSDGEFPNPTKGWVPYTLIDDDSDINKHSAEGDTGTLIIPQWKAEELGLV